MNPAILHPSMTAVLCDVGDGWVLEVGGVVLAEGDWADMMLLTDWYEECCAVLNKRRPSVREGLLSRIDCRSESSGLFLAPPV